MKEFDEKVNYLQDRLKVLADSLNQLGNIDKDHILSKFASASEEGKGDYDFTIYLVFFVAVLIVTITFGENCCGKY